jgi:hypothetical protein
MLGERIMSMKIQIKNKKHLIVFSLSILASIITGFNSLNLTLCGLYTTGVIKSSKQYYNPKRQNTTFLTFEFMNNKNDIVSIFTSSFSGDDVGKRVDIVYLADNPQNASINTFFHLWFYPTLFLAFGILYYILKL